MSRPRCRLRGRQGHDRAGGGSLSVFLAPEGRPFCAGAYFPKESRFGMTGFLDLLAKIAELWENLRGGPWWPESGTILPFPKRSVRFMPPSRRTTCGFSVTPDDGGRRPCPYLESYPAPEGDFAVYVCENDTSRTSVSDLTSLDRILEV